MKPRAKTSIGLAVLALALAGGFAAWWLARQRPGSIPAPIARTSPSPPPPTAPAPRAQPAPPSPIDDDSGVIDGRVVDAVTRVGVADAELSFTGAGGVSTFQTSSDGTFVLTPAVTGSFALATITAAGYLPYAPEPGRPRLHITLARGKPVHGITLALHAAIDHDGIVVDARGAPVAGARVRTLGGLVSDVALGSLGVEWTSGRDGHFTFQAAHDTVLEASRGAQRGWARVDRSAAPPGKLTIQLGRSPLEATITGHVRDPRGAPIADAIVRATTFGPVPAVFATTDADGAFTIANVDRAAYDLSAEADDHVKTTRTNVRGGSRDVELVLDPGLALAGQVVDRRGAPVPSFTLVVRRRDGAARPVALSQALIDPQGRFAVRVAPGDYDLLATTHGWARGTPTEATAGARDVRVVVGGAATLRGRIVAAGDRAPIDHAELALETQRRRLARPEPIAVTGADGSFELPDLAPGPLSLEIRAPGFRARIESLTIGDAAAPGPLTVELSRRDPDDTDGVDLVGIGATVIADGDAAFVFNVKPGTSASDAGLGYGDHIIAINGVAVAALGIERAIALLRGTAGTTVTLTVRRDGHDDQITVERRPFRA